MEFHYLAKNPFQQFHDWFKEAELKAGMANPNAMALATVGADGHPSVRMVLLKGVTSDGFLFFTNYESRKGKELEAHPFASLCFHWDNLDRQVRIEGAVERVAPAESDAYFHSRPRASQIGAWASKQSQEISSREELEKRVLDAEGKFRGQEIPRPPHWGGFLLRPERVEFWVGQPSRLHDRFLYVREGNLWKISRLSP